MNRILNWFFPSLLLWLMACTATEQARETLEVTSPSELVSVTFELVDGVPYYSVTHSGNVVIAPSKMGFRLKDAPPLNQNLSVRNHATTSFDETWDQPWGEVRTIRNHYSQLEVQLAESQESGRRLDIQFRVYDEGVGFRYLFPEQENLSDFQIMDEETEFALTGPHLAWWIPAYKDNRYEYLYQRTPITEIEAVHTPLTIETSDGYYLSIHEANLTDFASMAITNLEGNRLQCDLVPWADGVKVKTSTPAQTPWRTIQIARQPGDLITSYLILNLNEPNKLDDVSWIRPMKYVGIWWGMHIDKFTWESGARHGATTERTKQYIDFAAENGFGGVLVEGWNVGWDGDWMQNWELFSFTQPYADFDIEELAAYAASKGVELIGHHETSAGIANYEKQLEDAFAFYKKLGIDAVKTGYVGIRAHAPQAEEWHHGQYMVRHYRKVVEAAARHRVMLNVHEPIKDTGIRRTYPNMLTREGARGMEYDAWGEEGGNPPEHATILPFTRLLAGPFDFTPGIFDILFEDPPPVDNRSNTTLAKQLAFYVVIYSPLHMAADLPENYGRHPEAFQFIRDVPVDWDDTRVLNARIGDYVTIARKDRHSGDWYIGSVTDEEGRTFEVDLSFLDPGRTYVAQIYADGPDAGWESNPLSIQISEREVNSETRLELKLAPGGGQAIRLSSSE